MTHISERMKILVVGGAGYIGSHVCKSLLKAGHQPVIFDNFSSGRHSNIPDGVPFIHGDIRLDEGLLIKAMNGMDAVIHMAALKAAGESMTHPEKYATGNISGTIHLLNAMCAAGVHYLLFSSSAAVYGMPEYLPVDEKHPTEPINFYGYTKLEIERMIDWYGRLKGIKYVNLRYFNAAGYDVENELNGLEKNPANLLPVVMEVLKGDRKQLEVFGDDYNTRDGSCIRDYIHVSDLAEGHTKALEYLIQSGESDTFNLGTASGLTVFEIIKKAEELSGKKLPVKITGRREGDPESLLANSSKAEFILNWKAQYSDATTIISTMLKAYQLLPVS